MTELCEYGMTREPHDSEEAVDKAETFGTKLDLKLISPCHAEINSKLSFAIYWHHVIYFEDACV